MEIVVFAEQFKDGAWNPWEHTCSRKEANAVTDFAIERAENCAPDQQPIYSDFLESARQVFDVARGTPGNPKDGDTRVYCVCVDEVVIGDHNRIRQYSQKSNPMHESGSTVLDWSV